MMEPNSSNRGASAALAGPIAAASFVGGVAGALALSDAPYPRPGARLDQIRRYFSDNAGPARISIAGQLISAAALGVFAGSVFRLARHSGRGSGGLQAAALAGGAASVGTLAVSALTSAQLTRGAADQPAAALKLHERAFVAGGPLHGPGIGLLMGALGLAGLRTRALPNWLCVASLATAAAGLLAPLALILEPAVWLVPASRFPGLLLSAIAGAKLRQSA
jgi:hypothetical protein